MPDHEREQAQRGQVQLEGGGELGDGARGFARGDDARAWRQQPSHRGLVPLAVLEDQVHVAERGPACPGAAAPSPRPSAAGRRGLVWLSGSRVCTRPSTRSVSRRSPARTRSVEPGTRPWRPANDGTDEDGPGIGQECGERRIAARRRLPGGRGTGASASGSMPSTRRGSRPRSRALTTPSTTGRAGRTRELDAQPAVDLLREARRAAADLVGGAARRPPRCCERTPRRAAALARSIATTTATPSAMPRTISAGVQRPAHEVAHARAQQSLCGITRAFRPRSSAPGRRAPPPRGCASRAAASCRPRA